MADLQAGALAEGAQITFTFYWSVAKRWEGGNFVVRIAAWRQNHIARRIGSRTRTDLLAPYLRDLSLEVPWCGYERRDIPDPIGVLGRGGIFWLYGIIAVGAWVFCYRLVPNQRQNFGTIESHWRSGKQPREL
jgi:hypothetical protein